MANVLLISTYELGRQPFGLASPAAWLRRAGATVRCLDLAVERLDEEAVQAAELVAFYLPMHTATRIASRVIDWVRRLNPRARLCAYGLYAPVNAGLLRRKGVEVLLGGEFEEGLAEVVRTLGTGRQPGDANGSLATATVSLARQRFLVPDRSGLPPLSAYARLHLPGGDRRLVGYTEASRGCKHLCRHCPVVPVYRGRFRVVQADVVLEDIRRQVEAGAQHITFGDPDFFNGPKHALGLVKALHREFPTVTYDVTIKVEHLLRQARDLPVLRETGCAFVTTAVESLDDRVLALLEKGHTRRDFFRVVELFREVGLVLHPTFVAFHPWTTLEGYRELLATIAELELVENVAPIQLAIRLLIPAGSRLLELPELDGILGRFDEDALSYRWEHPDPRVDALQGEIEALVRSAPPDADRRAIFLQVWERLHRAMGREAPALPALAPDRARTTVPHPTEPWYC